jgi:hypothetical protein
MIYSTVPKQLQKTYYGHSFQYNSSFDRIVQRIFYLWDFCLDKETSMSELIIAFFTSYKPAINNKSQSTNELYHLIGDIEA